jgi:DNA polymerase III alpha subunit (gram-positive type)
MRREEIYISTDVETNGAIPGIHAMLSLASVAFDEAGNEIDSFEINLHELEGSCADETTMKWWNAHREAYDQTRKVCVKPDLAIEYYCDWLMALQTRGKLVFVAYPVAFDFMWVSWYLHRFKGQSPLGHNGIDIRSYAMALFKKSYSDSGKEHYPHEWFDNLTLTHRAIDDARMQGRVFINMKKYNERFIPLQKF